MSSAPPRIEDTGHSSKRQRVDEDGVPEDEKHALRKSLEEEHEAFKKKTQPLAEKLNRVDQCMELFKNTIKPAFGTASGGMAEYRNLERAFEQAKAEIASLQQAPPPTKRRNSATQRHRDGRETQVQDHHTHNNSCSSHGGVPTTDHFWEQRACRPFVGFRLPGQGWEVVLSSGGLRKGSFRAH
ncbi:hypothetical protein FNYG_08695 [Fusarium nygamai]|uniref:Uncharacterized protein n=1 Tax=Gibberella nygamai TaxID=42673 RepID=A0A2K0W6R8_GIBNY|nr:hypothetical protein FNYG_08695 [Fusarium nygamai]